MCVRSSLISPCFIWTMRDVNVINKFLECYRTMFYLNYEGCKQQCFYSFFVRKQRFIWTMRDVNNCFDIKMIPCPSCFIWTMRDVNSERYATLFRENDGFYLNYEGCKRLPRKIIVSQQPTFYLNYEGCKQRKIIIKIRVKTQFYLNYEGCKPSMTLTQHRQMLSFIWTMRDVNHTFQIVLILLLQRFIWTMRDVNLTYLLIANVKFVVLSELWGM